MASAQLHVCGIRGACTQQLSLRQPRFDGETHASFKLGKAPASRCRQHGGNSHSWRGHLMPIDLSLKRRERAKGTRFTCRAAANVEPATKAGSAISSRKIEFTGLNHVGLLVENIDRALEFYIGLLGLHVNKERPNDKLPYKGAWLWVGAEMIHLMELPNPDPLEGRPEHGGRDRHTCIGVADLQPVKEVLEEAGVRYTMSKSGRPALFCRDADSNALEISQLPAPQHEGSSVKHL